MQSFTYVAFGAVLCISVEIAASCSSDAETGTSGSSSQSTASENPTTSGGQRGSGGTSAAGGNTTSAGGSSSASTSSGVAGNGGCVQALCQGHIYQCGDCIDNDGDGLIDAADPDCLGPCQNNEDSYYSGIPGANNAPCKQDCYFDQDTGAGNDDCYWNHQCDPLEVAPNYYPQSWDGTKCAYNPNASTPGTNQTCDQLYSAQSQQCISYCGPLTPNGCDCFGCCELPAGSGKYVWLGSEDGSGNGTCDIAGATDPTKCEPCTPVAACLNTCETCELCVGKTTLPPECFPDGGGTGGSGGGSTDQCASGIQPCGLAGQSPCASGFYCITGCCQGVPK